VFFRNFFHFFALLRTFFLTHFTYTPQSKPASQSVLNQIINNQQSIINDFPILAFWQDFLGKYLIDLPVFFLDRFADTVYHRLTFTDDEQDCGFKRILSTVLSFGRRYA